MDRKFQAYDVCETYVTEGSERSVQAVRVYGVTMSGETREVVVTHIPFEMYVEGDVRVLSSMNVVVEKLNAYLISAKQRCGRTDCCGNRHDESKRVSYESCAKNKRTDRQAIIDYSVVQARGAEIYEENTRPFLRLKLSRSYYAKPIKQWIQRNYAGVAVYDVEPNPVDAFMLHKDFRAFQWYDAPSDVCRFDEISRVECNAVAPFVKTVFDIETIAKKYKDSESEEASYPVGCIVSTDATTGKTTAYVLGGEIANFVEPDPKRKTEIKIFADELECLRTFKNECLVPAHFVSGWNSDRFDLRYVFKRAERLGDTNFRDMGRGRTFRTYLDAFGKRKQYKVFCPGLLAFDCYKVILTDPKLKPYNYKLGTIAKHVLKNAAKGDLPYKKLFEAFHGTPSQRGELISYCAQDVDITMRIANAKKMFVSLMAKCLVKGVLPRDELYRGSSFTNMGLLKRYYKKGDVFLLLSKEEVRKMNHTTGEMETVKEIGEATKSIVGALKLITDAENGIKYEGGYVVDPEVGLYLDFQKATLDFASLYPNITRTRNICHTTQLTDPTAYPDPSKVWVSPLGFAYVKKEVRMGIIPWIMEDMVIERKRIKKAMKETKDSNEYERLDALQMQVKVVANSLYGLMGARTSDMSLLCGAASICKEGSSLAKNAYELIEAKFGELYGLRRIYGDTDSIKMVMTKSTSKEQTLEWIQNVARYINKEAGLLTGTLEFSIEDVGCILLTSGKKMYVEYGHEVVEATKQVVKEDGTIENEIVLELDEPKLKFKGLDNRNKTPYARRIQYEMCHRAMVECGDATEIYVKALKDVAEGKIDREELIHSQSLNKDLDEYENQEHVVAARQMVTAGESVRTDDRIEYFKCLIVGAGKNASDSVVAASLAEEYDLDLKKYVRDTINALAPLQDLVKDYVKLSNVKSYPCKRGTYKYPPPQEARIVGKRKIATAQSGGIDKFVKRTKSRKAVPGFDELAAEE